MSLPENYKQFEAYADKKSPGFFAGWQKRYWKILDGKLMCYFDSKEDKGQPKGTIHFVTCSTAEEIPGTQRQFKFTVEDKEFILRAETPEAKLVWIACINKCVEECNKEQNAEEQKKKSQKATGQSHKMESMDKGTLEILQSYGISTSENQRKSEEMFAAKGLADIFNLKDPKVKNKIHYGFLYKPHKLSLDKIGLGGLGNLGPLGKSKDLFSKRWFFIYSSISTLIIIGQNEWFIAEKKNNEASNTLKEQTRLFIPSINKFLSEGAK